MPNSNYPINRRFETSRPFGVFMAIERLLTGGLREQIKELMATEDLVMEAMKDLLKDEIKAHVRNVIEDDPELKADLKDAINTYFLAQMRSVYAELKASRAAARLGLRLLPEEMHGEVGDALIGLFEKEIGTLLEKAL